MKISPRRARNWPICAQYLPAQYESTDPKEEHLRRILTHTLGWGVRLYAEDLDPETRMPRPRQWRVVIGYTLVGAPSLAEATGRALEAQAKAIIDGMQSYRTDE